MDMDEYRKKRYLTLLKLYNESQVILQDLENYVESIYDSKEEWKALNKTYLREELGEIKKKLGVM